MAYLEPLKLTISGQFDQILVDVQTKARVRFRVNASFRLGTKLTDRKSMSKKEPLRRWRERTQLLKFTWSYDQPLLFQIYFNIDQLGKNEHKGSEIDAHRWRELSNDGSQLVLVYEVDDTPLREWWDGKPPKPDGDFDDIVLFVSARRKISSTASSTGGDWIASG